jgi:2-polyprenyl-3-methyl-5-hydroxy-6-metoxy-1,4-benzoquinol methylase
MSEQPADSSDIQTILANLQEEIRQHRLVLGELGAVERPDPLAKVRKHAWVNSHLPIGWPVMPRGIIARIRAYSQKIVRRLLRWYINPIVDQQNAYNAAVTEALAQAFAKIEEQAQHLRELEDALDGLGGEQRQFSHDQEVARLRLQRLENWHGDSQPTLSPPATMRPAADQPAPAVDYFLLGAQHRSEAQLAARVHDYDDLFGQLRQRQAQSVEPVRPVLDIGCGRGELVEHLKEMGLEAYGIDLDTDALRMATATGRQVEHAEALAHLAGLEDGSLAAITLIQVIEHLPIPDLQNLFSLAVSKLAPGGFIIAETINPVCLVALTHAYLLDPSHHTLLHPQMTRFLMEQAGFWKIKVRFMRPVDEAGRLEQMPALPGATSQALATLNRNTAKLNDFLYGPQDYAAVAYKPEEKDA